MALSHATPRSALRTINEDQSSLNAMKSKQASLKPGLSAPVSGLFKKPLQTLSKGNGAKTQLHIHTDTDCKPKIQLKEKVVTQPPETLPEKEHMNIFDPAEDLKPKVDEALSGLVEKICKWRPPCLFGAGSPSDSDEEEDVIQVRNPPVLPPPEEPLSDFDFANLSDLDIPDELPVPTVDIEDLPLPYLDDSLDIEPNMGTLEIWETSACASVSPSKRSRSPDRD